MVQIAISALTSTAPVPTGATIRAVVTLLWPYSSSTRQCALLLSDPDFRQRNIRGQVRVRFTGSSAKAVAQSRLGIGDTIVLSLEGAVWANDGTTTQTPGKSVDGELSWSRTLKLGIEKDGTVESITVDPESSPRPAPISPHTVTTPLAQGAVNSFDNPGRSSIIPIYSSPAFSKRLRLSGDLFLDPAYDPLAHAGSVAPQDVSNSQVFRRDLQWRLPRRPSSPRKVSDGEGFLHKDPEQASFGHGAAASLADSPNITTPVLQVVEPVFADEYPPVEHSRPDNTTILEHGLSPANYDVFDELYDISDGEERTHTRSRATISSEPNTTARSRGSSKSEVYPTLGLSEQNVQLISPKTHIEQESSPGERCAGNETHSHKRDVPSPHHQLNIEQDAEKKSVMANTFHSLFGFESEQAVEVSSFSDAGDHVNSTIGGSETVEEYDDLPESTSRVEESIVEVLKPEHAATLVPLLQPEERSPAEARPTNRDDICNVVKDSQVSFTHGVSVSFAKSGQHQVSLLEETSEEDEYLPEPRVISKGQLVNEDQPIGTGVRNYNHVNGSQDAGQSDMKMTILDASVTPSKPERSNFDRHRALIDNSAPGSSRPLPQEIPRVVGAEEMTENQATTSRPMTTMPQPRTPTAESQAPDGSYGSRLSRVPAALSTWFSPKATAISKFVDVSERSYTELDVRSVALKSSFGSPKRTAEGLQTSLGYFNTLAQLERMLNPQVHQASGRSGVDILAVVTKGSTEPLRCKAGPRDYCTVIQVSDASLAPSSSIRVEVYRPWKAKLPMAEAGDVALLRAFVVKSRQRQPYLISGDESAYCIWRFGNVSGAMVDNTTIVEEKVDVPEEMNGPPVEFGETERQKALVLHEWWAAETQQTAEHVHGPDSNPGGDQSTDGRNNVAPEELMANL